MFNFVLGKLMPKRYQAIKSFSYFLPAPPKRNYGYQEKEFDRAIEHLRGLGYELLDIKTQAHSHGEAAGVWVFCRLGALTREAAKNPISLSYQEIAGNGDKDIPLDPSIVHEN